MANKQNDIDAAIERTKINRKSYEEGLSCPDNTGAALAKEGVEYCDKILSALEAQRDGGWQPIETAPKGGSTYIGIIEFAPNQFGEPFMCNYDKEKGHICVYQTEIIPHKPTHWMPLPQLPETEGE